jgi:hypothetical protein
MDSKNFAQIRNKLKQRRSTDEEYRILILAALIKGKRVLKTDCELSQGFLDEMERSDIILETIGTIHPRRSDDELTLYPGSCDDNILVGFVYSIVSQ